MMVRLPQVVTKLAEEDYKLSVDFAADLKTGETILSGKVFARRPYYGTDATSELFPDAPTVSGTVVSVRIVGGKAKERFAVRVIAVLNTTPAQEIGSSIDVRVD